jgi:protein-S-isoprenylcysteine O-methyltransferase Ste14
MAWSSLPLSGWLRWMGVGVFAIAAVLFLWTVHVLGPNLTDTVVTRRAHTLVSSGPYRYVRHPFYAAGFLLFLASSLIAANWFLLAGVTLVYILIAIRTRTEEKNLVARFGDDYRAYMKQTGRFWPLIMKAKPSG